MEENPNKSLPAWKVRTWGSIYNLTTFIFGTFVLGIVLGVFVNWVYSEIPLPPYLTDLTVHLKQGIEWGVKNPLIVLFVAFIVLLLRLLARQYHQVEVPFSDRQLEIHYLHSMIKETEMHALKEIPSDLIPQSVKLEDVFIPLQFRRNQPMIDHPLTIDELDGQPHLSEHERARLFDAIKESWQYFQKKEKAITIADLLQAVTKEKPMAVILGLPGMGKSTLIQALILNMAYCCLDLTWYRHFIDVFKHSSQPFLDIKSPLIPIFVSLGDYANERAKNDDLSLYHYIKRSISKWNIDGLENFIDKCLRKGRCLILFDGLNDAHYKHRQIVNEIKEFVSRYRRPLQKTSSFNRFLITSRVAGYNRHDFTDCLHYTISDLTNEQVKEGLNKWYRAIISNHLDFQDEQRESIDDEVERRAGAFYSTVEKVPRVHDLARRPLLLTLLVLMEQSNIELSKQRVDLYRRVTSMLLQKHKDDQGKPVISEEKVIQRLGPLALWMQEYGKRLIYSSEVKAKLKATMNEDGISDDQLTYKMETFLTQVREEGGLFVYRTDDDLGFSHSTFQEYFIARYLLNKIKTDPANGIADLVDRARRPDDLWREPFLLAVAYQSYEDKIVANQIIIELLKASSGSGIESRAHDLCLAAVCLIETKPFSMEPKIQKEIAEHLLKTYEDALQNQQFAVCKQIAEAIIEWLLSSSGSNHYCPPLHRVLREYITLTLLLIQAAWNRLTRVDNGKGYEAILDIAAHSSVDTEREIVGVLQMLETANDELMQRVCMASLMAANPSTSKAINVLEAGLRKLNGFSLNENDRLSMLQVLDEIDEFT